MARLIIHTGIKTYSELCKDKSFEEIYGKEKAKQIKEKMSGPRDTYNRIIVQCVHCCLLGKGPNMSRYHFNNCKLNPDNEKNILGKFSLLEKINKRNIEITCPICGYIGRGTVNMKRWHFDNCKSNNKKYKSKSEYLI